VEKLQRYVFQRFTILAEIQHRGKFIILDAKQQRVEAIR
jgi:hypothetical protein